jgi:hypothetical protein
MGNLASSDLTQQAIRTSGRTYVQDFPEAASQTFVAGDILAITSDGRVAIAVAAGSNLDSTGDRIVGQAIEAASGVTAALVKVEVWTVDTRIDLPKYSATPGTAATAYTDVDTQTTLKNDSDFGWVWDFDTTSNPVVHILKVVKSYDGKTMTVGGQYNPLRGKIIALELFDNS